MTSKAIKEIANDDRFLLRVFFASLIVLGVVVVAGLVWQAGHYLLLFFAGILLAILLDAIASLIGRAVPMPRGPRLLIAVLITASAIGAIGLIIPTVVEQAPEFARYFERWVEWIRQTVLNFAPLRESMENGQSSSLTELLPNPSEILGGAAQIVGGAVSILTGAALVAVFGIYLSAEPSRYYQGGLSILSPALRKKFAVIGDDIGIVLRRWMAGQVLMMLLIGLSSYAVLSLLGVPLALMLSFIAGLTAFIPYIGPLIGGGAMIIVATTQSVTLGLVVVGFYVILQLVESYVLTPLIQSHAIFVPPAIVIFAQVIFGVLFGLLGVALATPLAAVIAVIVNRVYFGHPIDA